MVTGRREARVHSSFFYFILAVAALLRGIEAFRRPLQVDEALMVDEARLPIRAGLANIAADVHPPLVLFLLRPLEMIHASDFEVRLLMIAFGLASIALIYAIVKLWTDPVTALFTAGLAAAMPTIAHYDTWIRMYAPLSTVELLGWYSLSMLLSASAMPPVRRRIWWAVWIASATAGVYLHYLAWISLGCQVLWILATRRDFVRPALIGAAAVLVLWLPQLRTFLAQTSHGGRSWAFALSHPVSAILQIPGEALLHVETPFGLDPIRVFGLLWTLGALAIVLIDSRNTVLPWLGLSALVTIAVSLALKLSLYGDRYFLVLAYAVCAWTALGMTRLNQWRPRYQLAAIGALAILASYSTLLAYEPYYYTADWPSVAAFLQTQSRPVEPLLAEQSSAFLALTHYAPLNDHKLVGVDAGGDTAAAAVRYSQKFDRVWLVVFESTAVDPSEDLITGLNKEMVPIRYVRFVRASISETVLVAEYDRQQRRRNP